jgi:hypothetical protein
LFSSDHPAVINLLFIQITLSLVEAGDFGDLQNRFGGNSEEEVGNVSDLRVIDSLLSREFRDEQNACHCTDDCQQTGT